MKDNPLYKLLDFYLFDASSSEDGASSSSSAADDFFSSSHWHPRANEQGEFYYLYDLNRDVSAADQATSIEQNFQLEQLLLALLRGGGDQSIASAVAAERHLRVDAQFRKATGEGAGRLLEALFPPAHYTEHGPLVPVLDDADSSQERAAVLSGQKVPTATRGAWSNRNRFYLHGGVAWTPQWTLHASFDVATRNIGIAARDFITTKPLAVRLKVWDKGTGGGGSYKTVLFLRKTAVDKLEVEVLGAESQLLRIETGRDGSWAGDLGEQCWRGGDVVSSLRSVAFVRQKVLDCAVPLWRRFFEGGGGGAGWRVLGALGEGLMSRIRGAAEMAKMIVDVSERVSSAGLGEEGQSVAEFVTRIFGGQVPEDVGHEQDAAATVCEDKLKSALATHLLNRSEDGSEEDPASAGDSRSSEGSDSSPEGAESDKKERPRTTPTLGLTVRAGHFLQNFFKSHVVRVVKSLEPPLSVKNAIGESEKALATRVERFEEVDECSRARKIKNEAELAKYVGKMEERLRDLRKVWDAQVNPRTLRTKALQELEAATLAKSIASRLERERAEAERGDSRNGLLIRLSSKAKALRLSHGEYLTAFTVSDDQCQ